MRPSVAELFPWASAETARAQAVNQGAETTTQVRETTWKTTATAATFLGIGGNAAKQYPFPTREEAR